MKRLARFMTLTLVPFGLVAAVQPARQQQSVPVRARIETTLRTASGHIRQFAFDGDAESYFASVENAGKADHFTLIFDRPVRLKSIVVTTGRALGGKDATITTSDLLAPGKLQFSADGKHFETGATFKKGKALAEPDQTVRAIRLKPSADLGHSLAVREIAIVSEPPVQTFRYPVEFVVNVGDAPDMKDWAEKVAAICAGAYPMINKELKSKGFRPPHVVHLNLKNNYGGVAMCSGDRITGSVKYFKAHPDDVGAMVHETVHVVQHYRTPNAPGWLVEGIADYIRFFRFEPGKLGRINPKRARYNGSYRVSAAFLASVTEKYNKNLVRELNKTLREGEYNENIWKTLTKKTLKELGAEWQASLQKNRNE